MAYVKTKSGVLLPPAVLETIKVAALRRGVMAKYDAAQTTSENTRHWSFSDALSPDAAANSGVRHILRNRARYEVANNSYAAGIVATLANDCIGTGPRLQVQLPAEYKPAEVEQAFADWCDEIGLTEKLNTMRRSKVTDGEAFGVFVRNSTLSSPVKLDIRLIEADQVTTPFSAANYSGIADGVELDESGNPRAYYVLKNHPGSAVPAALYDCQKFAAQFILHWYTVIRPGQNRGIPELTPALVLFAYLRRYTLAVIAAAETAASFSAVLKVQPGEDDTITPFDSFDIERNMITTVPGELAQFKAEQPTTTYGEFKHEILDEIARCLNMPSNISRGNSSSYNYSSGRLDHQVYHKSLRVEQGTLKRRVLDRIFDAWVSEAVLISDMLPLKWRTLSRVPRQWFFDGWEHVDPVKEADADQTNLESGNTGYPEIYAKKGQDYQVAMTQQAQALGLTLEAYQQKLVEKLFGSPITKRPQPVENANV